MAHSAESPIPVASGLRSLIVNAASTYKDIPASLHRTYGDAVAASGMWWI